MTEETIEDFRKKHFENYKNAVLETLKNNTTALFMDDILSLLQKPPLDSMDIIKCKFLDLAKKYNTIIQSETLNRLLEEYRNDIISYISEWEVIRIKELKAIIEKFVPKKETDVIKFNKKDFTPLNRKLKKKMKADIMVILNKKIVNNVNSLFTDDLDEKIEKNL